MIRANDFICDVISRKADKANTLDALLKMNHLDWKETSTIGDTDADAESIQKAGFGVTLENGSDLCKKMQIALCLRVMKTAVLSG